MCPGCDITYNGSIFFVLIPLMIVSVGENKKNKKNLLCIESILCRFICPPFASTYTSASTNKLQYRNAEVRLHISVIKLKKLETCYCWLIYISVSKQYLIIARKLSNICKLRSAFFPLINAAYNSCVLIEIEQNFLQKTIQTVFMLLTGATWIHSNDLRSE